VKGYGGNEKGFFPCDFTENSAKILSYDLAVSEKYDNMIYLLHVIETFCRTGIDYPLYKCPMIDQQGF